MKRRNILIPPETKGVSVRFTEKERMREFCGDNELTTIEHVRQLIRIHLGIEPGLKTFFVRKLKRKRKNFLPIPLGNIASFYFSPNYFYFFLDKMFQL